MDDTGQLEMDIVAPRRIDTTFATLDKVVAAMPEDERAATTADRRWNLLVIASRLRSMEMSEGHNSPQTMADTYDQIVEPGENAAEAILRVLVAVFPKPGNL